MSFAAAARPVAMDCLRRWAALPVGAAIAMVSIDTPVHASARRSATTIVVLPVPGPPVTSASDTVSAVRTARFCSSVSSGGPPRDRLEGAGECLRVLLRGAGEPLAHARAEALLEHAHPLDVEPVPVDHERRPLARATEDRRNLDVPGARPLEHRTRRWQRRLRANRRERRPEARVDGHAGAACADGRDARRGEDLHRTPGRRVEPLRAAGDLPSEVCGLPLFRIERRPRAVARLAEEALPRRAGGHECAHEGPPANRRARSAPSQARTSSQAGREDQTPRPSASSPRRNT